MDFDKEFYDYETIERLELLAEDVHAHCNSDDDEKIREIQMPTDAELRVLWKSRIRRILPSQLSLCIDCGSHLSQLYPESLHCEDCYITLLIENYGM